MLGRAKGLFTLALSFSLALSLLAGGCAPPQSQPVSPSSDNRGINLPAMPYPDKGNPKLDTFLNQLILAAQRGEAESFAMRRNVKLVDGKVRVQIEAMPGQLDAAARAAGAVGTVELISHRLNHVQAVVPITSLTTLAEENSIKMIATPITPVIN